MARDNVLYKFDSLIGALKVAKPGDRGELDRVYAVTITEIEKAFGYFEKYTAPREGDADYGRQDPTGYVSPGPVGSDKR